MNKAILQGIQVELRVSEEDIVRSKPKESTGERKLHQTIQNCTDLGHKGVLKTSCIQLGRFRPLKRLAHQFMATSTPNR